ncbi:MAG: hypothetical protein LBK92_02795 [Endomicrobium sp.]|jgi:hypothetical protein|nr:hypothetical protein [Endomicrobium sp.]
MNDNTKEHEKEVHRQLEETTSILKGKLFSWMKLKEKNENSHEIGEGSKNE